MRAIALGTRLDAGMGDRAGTEILAYLLDLQLSGIPIDIMTTGMQADRRSPYQCLRNQRDR